jgi:hypothetical protein
MSLVPHAVSGLSAEMCFSGLGLLRAAARGTRTHQSLDLRPT